MRTTNWSGTKSQGSGAGRCRRRVPWRLSSLLQVACMALPLGCRGEPAGLGEPVGPAVLAPVVELRAGDIIDLGVEARTHVMDGFSLPERIGPRLASWSEGERSSVTLNLRGGEPEYLIAFLGEPYHRLGAVSVNVELNGQPLRALPLEPHWRAYQVKVAGEHVRAGRNELVFRYSETARPRDFDPSSTDMRDLSVRFDQIQVQPLADRVDLQFGSRNALSLSSLGEGWARDPGDRGTGTWTVERQADITFHLVGTGERLDAAYRIGLTARTPRGVTQRQVAVQLNGEPLGQLVFHQKKSTASLDLPGGRLRAQNRLSLEFGPLETPAQLDPRSKDTRLLGLRVFSLRVAPAEELPLEHSAEVEPRQPMAEATLP